MASRLDRILAYVRATPWAILPAAADRMADVLVRRARGVRLSQDEIDAAVGADREAYAARRAAAAGQASAGAVALIPVYGTILGRDWQFTQASHGGTTCAEALMRELAAADANPQVGTVVLDIDSPGGQVSLLPELASAIAAMTKPVVAQVNTMAASAAYWLAASASEIVVSPSADVGSIGIVQMHVDQSASLEQDGIRVSLIHAGDHKVDGNPFEPLSDEARADLQKAVDEYHAMFIAAVAKGRGVSRAAVRSQFGDGRMFRAQEAVERGMADSIATLDQTLARLGSGGRGRRSARAAARGDAFDFEEPEDEASDPELPVATAPAPATTPSAQLPDALAPVHLRHRRALLDL